MGTTIRLKADDGHEFGAYRADPSGRARGGVVVVQEIFGVNAHIRAVADRFAQEGYAALAPALFDRIERDVDLGYTDETVAKGRGLRGALGFEAPLRDIAAAIAALRRFGKVGVAGYCWGGSLAWLSACRLDADCAVCYYGAQIKDFLDEKPRCPVLMHFGERDALIPRETAAAIRAAQPDVRVFAYPAGHGFNCDMRADYDAASSAAAFARTRALLREFIG